MKRQEAQALKIFQSPLGLVQGETYHLRFGPLDLYLESAEKEICVRWMTSNDWLDSSFHYHFPFDGMCPQNLLEEKRFAYSSSHPVIKIRPCLGELPFVVKPDTQLMILPGERAQIFLSTPMNLQLYDVDRSQVIDEIPVLYRVKTWFGESPTRGQLCFFTKISAALKEENIPFRPHRALTHIFVENNSPVPLPIQKLKIPVNFLTLYQDDRGVFITSSLSLKSDKKGQLKDLKISPPAQGAGELHLVQEPREQMTNHFFKSITELMR